MVQLVTSHAQNLHMRSADRINPIVAQQLRYQQRLAFWEKQAEGARG